MLTVIYIYGHAECYNAECRIYTAMLSVAMQNDVMPSVVTSSAAAPLKVTSAKFSSLFSNTDFQSASDDATETGREGKE